MRVAEFFLGAGVLEDLRVRDFFGERGFCGFGEFEGAQSVDFYFL